MKKNYVILSALLLALGSTACASKESAKNAEQDIIGADNKKADNGKNTEESGLVKSILENTPPHINTVFDDNYTVDADVQVPNVSKADILSAKYMRLDEQALLAAFYSKKTPEKETGDAGYVSYKDGDSELYMTDEYTRYRTNAFQSIYFPIENFLSESEIFFDGKRFSEVYKKDELDFMKKEKAVKKARNTLKQLSIETTEAVEVYAADFATLQRQQDERIQKEIDIQERMGSSPIQDPTDGYQAKETFTRKDECYIIYFTILQNQIPVTKNSYNILDGERTLSGSTARLLLSAKGVIAFEENGIYQSTGIAESPDTIISAEQAVKNAYEIRNGILSPGKAAVNRIDFEYVPVAYNKNYNEVKLTPAWSLTVTYDNGISEKDGEENIRTERVYINAVTGEEIK